MNLLVSPITAAWTRDDVEWRTVNGYRTPARIGTAPPAGARLCDLTQVARTGFKGLGASDWLRAEGVLVPATPNRCMRDGDGGIIARLGQEDFLIIDALGGPAGLVARLEQRWARLQGAGRRVGRLTPRQHSHVLLHLGGAQAVDVLARLCAVDLRPAVFAPDAIAQTMAAGVVVTVLRDDRGGVPGYLMLVDSSLAAYAWDALIDAMEGFAGGAIGFEQLAGEQV